MYTDVNDCQAQPIYFKLFIVNLQQHFEYSFMFKPSLVCVLLNSICFYSINKKLDNQGSLYHHVLTTQRQT
jgi:hypothetical protein